MRTLTLGMATLSASAALGCADQPASSLVATHDGAAARIYLDSVLVETHTIPTFSAPGSQPLTLSADSAGGYPADAKRMSAILMNDRALSADEILHNYDAARTRHDR